MAIKKSLGVLILMMFAISAVSAVPTGLTISYPAEGGGYKDAVNSITWSFSGELNLSSDKCWYQSNGGDWTEFACSTSPISGISHIEGDNLWALKINDSTSSVEKNVNFWVDSIEPQVTFTGPAAYTNQNFFEITWDLIETNKYDYGLNQFSKLWIWQPFGDSYPDLLDATVPGVKLATNYYKHTSAEDLSQDGTYHYFVRVADKYPNGTKIRDKDFESIIIRDTIAPTISDDYGSDGVWVTSDQIVTLTADDTAPASGINYVRCCTGIECNPDEGENVAGAPYQLIYNTDQNTWVACLTRDNAGNPSDAAIFNVMIDKTAPETANNAPEGWQSAPATVNLLCTDDEGGSGCAETVFCVDADNTCTPNRVYGGGDVLVDADGYSYIRYYSTDNVGNSEEAKSIAVQIDLSAPASAIIAPGAGSWHNTNFLVSRSDLDLFSGLALCEVMVQAQIGEWTTTVDWTPVECNADYLVPLEACPAEGADACRADIRATDAVGWISEEELRTFGIDTTAPSTLAEGVPGDWTNADVTITLNPSDALSGIVETLFCVDSTDTCTPDRIGTEVLVTAEGASYVRFFSRDNAGNEEGANSAMVLIDKSGPDVEVTAPSPADKSGHSLGTSFDFHVEDSDYYTWTDSCTLTINDIDYAMEQEESWDYFGFEPEAAGQNIWHITCLDALGNPTITDDYSFTILAEPANAANFDSITDLTAEEDISDVLGFFVENAFGKILWLEAIDFSSGFDWSLLASITNNLISVDSTTPELNKSAEITIYNISFANPATIEILREGAVCSAPICNVLSYNATEKTLVFNVTGFTNYSSQQGAYCGDGSCNNGESCSSCSTDCGTCSTGGSGGGGGGSSATCTSIWSCTDWSACSLGTQTRTCADLSGGCTSGTKPAEMQTCAMPSSSETEEESATETNNNEENGFGGITGAVIGNRAVQAGIAIAFVIIIAAAALLISRKSNAQIKVQPAAAAHTARAEEE